MLAMRVSHSEDQIAQLAGSIRAFGFMVPVLIDKDSSIIAGHARVLAARKLGLDRVPVIVVDHLTESEKRAYAIADNKIALNADWDQAMLRVEMEALKAEQMDLAILGFNEDEFNALIDELDAEIYKADEDTLPDTSAQIVS